jgi:hypothetical protein
MENYNIFINFIVILIFFNQNLKFLKINFHFYIFIYIFKSQYYYLFNALFHNFQISIPVIYSCICPNKCFIDQTI